MSAPTWSPVDEHTADLLDLVADAERPVGRDAVSLFLAACEEDADENGGYVSVNRVRVLMEGAGVPARRYSSFWAHFTGKGRPMVPTSLWEPCEGSASGNDGRPFRLRKWVGYPTDTRPVGGEATASG